MKEIVTCEIAGTPYGGWKSMAVAMSAKSPERTFEIAGAMGGSDIEAALFDANPDDLCVLKSNGDALVTGYIESVEIMMDHENREVRISGKSRGADATRNSIDHDSHEWTDQDLLAIAKSLDKSGIGYKTDEDLKKLAKVRANVGETQIQLLGRLADRERLYMVGDDDGGVLITRHGKYRHSGGIIEGDNFLRGSAKKSTGDRKAKIIVKGHRPKGSGKDNFRYQRQAVDPGARKGTVKVITPEQELLQAEAQEVAEGAADDRLGRSVQLQCELQGFRDRGGKIWRVGWNVWCEVPSIRLGEDLGINTLTLHQDEHGTLSKLVLVHPAALGGKGGGKSTKFNNAGKGSFRGRLTNK